MGRVIAIDGPSGAGKGTVAKLLAKDIGFEYEKWDDWREWDPRQPPLEFHQRYYRQPPPLPANFRPQLPFDNGMMNGGRDENLGAWPRTEAMIRDQLAEYHGLITHMDEQIGRILAALKESGRGENTIVIFAAENGLALGSHGLLGKQSVFEHSMRTPLIMAGPGIPKGKSTAAFTYLLDLFPTLCDTLA